MSSDTQLKSRVQHRAMAVALDIIVLLAFVFGGAGSHNSEYRIGDVLIIGLPFAACFFATILVVSNDIFSIKAAAIASVISIPLAMLIRINLPQLVGREEYSFKPVFFIISFVFLTALWTGWRYLYTKLRPGG